MPVISSLRKSATPSSNDRRSPASTLSANGASAESLIRCRSSRTGMGTALLLESFDGERHVVAAEAEAVAQDGLHRTIHCRIRRVVEVELRIGMLIVDCRRNDAVADGERANDELHRAGGAEHVTGHRLRRAHGDRARVVAEHRLDRLRLVEIVGGRGPVSYTHLRAHETPEHLV